MSESTKELWDKLENWEWDSLTTPMQEYVIALGKERDEYRKALLALLDAIQADVSLHHELLCAHYAGDDSDYPFAKAIHEARDLLGEITDDA